MELLTPQHRCEVQEEADGVRRRGGEVGGPECDRRVGGVLQLSRSLGDAMLGLAVSPDPEVRVVKRRENWDLLLVASDGVWDRVTVPDAAQAVLRPAASQPWAPRTSAERLLARASLDSPVGKDDVTIIVVDLANPHLPPPLVSPKTSQAPASEPSEPPDAKRRRRNSDA